MKTIFFVFCLLIANTFSLFAQNPYEWIRQIEDSSSFTTTPAAGTPQVGITDITVGHQAVYMVAYSKRIDLNTIFIHFMKYSSDGTLIWRKEIQNINSDWYNPDLKLVILAEEIIIYGVLNGTIVTNQTTYNIIGTSSFAVKYDSAGNEIWLKGFPSFQMKNISVFADSLLIFGLTRKFTASGVIMSSDKDVNFLADSLMVNNTAATSSNFFFDVDNNTYYQYGYSNGIFTCPNNTLFASVGNYDGFIIKNSLIDSSFYYLKQLEGVENEYISQLQLDSQGNLYVVASSYCYQCNATVSIDGFTMQSNRKYVIKIAPNGTVLWVKEFGEDGGIYASAMRNDELIIGGEYRSTVGTSYCGTPSYPDFWDGSSNDNPMCGYTGTVVHANPNDGSQPGFRIGGNRYDAVTALAIDNDGALYFTLSSNSDTIYFDGDSQHFFKENGAIFLAKMYPWAITSTENEQVKSAAFHVFPNPCADFFTIDTALPYDYMEITNVLGEAVYQTNISAPQYISTKDLAKGLYFVTLYHKNQTLGRQKLLVQ